MNKNDMMNIMVMFQIQRVTLGDGQVCAGGEAGDSCAGDSGSALMLEVSSTVLVTVLTRLTARCLQVMTRNFDPRVLQVGVVSFGPRRCGTRGVPAIYTRVENYVPWIMDSLAL